MALLEKEWFIQAPWGRLCIIAWGDCYDPPVLVCHGDKDAAVSFRPLINLLPRNFYYIGLELPGNGKSDPMPPGLMVSVYDLLYSLRVVVKHFRWDNFNFLGHSFGCTLGVYYDLCYPGKISKSINIDPISLGIAVPEGQFPEWYKLSFTDYFDNYDKYTSNRDRPKYGKEEAVAKVMERRGFNEEQARALVERVTEPVEGGLIRFIFDERLHKTTHTPFSPEHVKKLFTSIKTPTLSIIASESKQSKKYLFSEYLLDEKSYGGNYRVREVEGRHDVHVTHPEKVAMYVRPFLLQGLQGLDNRAKL